VWHHDGGEQLAVDDLEAIVIGTDIRIEPEALRRYLNNRRAVSPLIGQLRLTD
jgi:hypothetical protein